MPDPDDNLFAAPERRRRERLRALGWTETPQHGRNYWRDPEGRVYTEREAFAELDAREEGSEC